MTWIGRANCWRASSVSATTCVAMPFTIVFGGAGPLLAGALYDWAGNYILAFSAFAAFQLFGIALVYGAVVAGAYAALRRDRRGALVLGLAVVSHWLLDALTHRPDLPLLPSSPTLVGLGLWNSVAATVVVEGTMFAGAAAMYLRSTRALDTTGRIATWVLLALLAVIYLLNIFSPAPPPGVDAIAWSAFGMWLFVLLAAWADRHRTTKSAVSA